MASIPVTLDGIMYDLLNRTTQRVLILADASLQGVSIGGGPIQPPPGGGQQPGYPPHPAFPIYGPGIPTQPVDPGFGVGGPGKPPGGGVIEPPKPGDATPPPGSPPKPTAPPTSEGTWYWNLLWAMWVWVPAASPPPTGGTTPPSTDVGPAHPIAPTVPQPKR
jgi:hypothetical protein